jgi:hypothetical protein
MKPHYQRLMKVFFSWSGARSHAVAKALGEWASGVIQAVEPWISSEIEKGAKWGQEVAARLEEVRFGYSGFSVGFFKCFQCRGLRGALSI